MAENFDIDHLKKDWQNQKIPSQYNDEDILKMLNQKSRNYVKYIFWISIVEFLVLLTISILYVFGDNHDDNYLNLLQKLGVKKTPELVMNFEHLSFAMKVISLLVSAVFMVLFYINYKKIKVEENLKKFISRIVKLKKTVNLFIITNISLVFAFVLILAAFMFKALSDQKVKLPEHFVFGFFLGILLSFFIAFVLILCYYKVVYGIIMKKLDKNMKQLKEIEQNQEE